MLVFVVMLHHWVYLSNIDVVFMSVGHLGMAIGEAECSPISDIAFSAPAVCAHGTPRKQLNLIECGASPLYRFKKMRARKNRMNRRFVPSNISLKLTLRGQHLLERAF